MNFHMYSSFKTDEKCKLTLENYKRVSTIIKSKQK